MSSDESTARPQSLPEGRFSGRTEFAELIRRALASAAAQEWREIILCDPDFADWPLGEREVTQSLNDWSKSGRKLTMLARNYDTVLRKHARFVVWRKTWSHILDCRSIALAPSETFPSAIWSPDWVMERLDLPRCIGVSGTEVERRVALKERLNERILNASPSFPATVLGL